MNNKYLSLFVIIAICFFAFFTTVESRAIKSRNAIRDERVIVEKIKSLELEKSTTDGDSFDSVSCPDGSVCPNSNTCCPASGGSYACCPTPNAQCCSDKQHCCPYQFTCGNGGNICKPGNNLRITFNH